MFKKSNMFIWSTWDAKDGVTQPAITNKLIISKKRETREFDLEHFPKKRPVLTLLKGEVKSKDSTDVAHVSKEE